VASTDGKPRVLVKEKIADSGVSLLREDFDVELGLDMSDDELSERIGDFDAIVVRSATQVTSDLIERASRLKVVGRAGTGVSEDDRAAARTERGAYRKLLLTRREPRQLSRRGGPQLVAHGDHVEEVVAEASFARGADFAVGQ
jgi:lactate dehydrogenase-like 2-hydroxyacid dehydrogenase